jgi:single-stranded-DNA-specific exonuclease
MDEKLDVNRADYYLPYVAMGLISDMMDMKSYETRFLTLKGIDILNQQLDLFNDGKEDEIENSYIKELIRKLNAYGSSRFSFKSIGWEVAPMGNAVARVGTRDETLKLIESMTGSTEMVSYQPRRKKGEVDKPPIEIRTIQKDIMRICTNCRSKQTNWAKKIAKQCDEDIINNELYNNQVIIVNASDYFKKKEMWKLSGIIASQIAEKYNKPTLVLKNIIDGEYTGSGRNYNDSPVEDFRGDLGKYSDIIGLGHDSAFGCFIGVDNLEKDLAKMNEAYKDYKMKPVFLVDFITNLNRIKAKDIKDIYKYHDVFGTHTLPTPLFIVKAVIDVDKDVSLLGTSHKILKITKNPKIAMIKYHGKQDDILALRGIGKKGLTVKGWAKTEITCVCSADVNEWNGEEYPQLIIKDWDFKEYIRPTIKGKGKRRSNIKF